MKKWLAMALALMGGACADTAGPTGDPPIRLAGVMKLAADSLTVSLRVTNVSDTTQVIAWHDCASAHPANFGLFQDQSLTRQIWEQQRLPRVDCQNFQQAALAPEDSHLIQGWPVGIGQILGDSIADGVYHIAIIPVTLTVRPSLGSYDMPVQGTVGVGSIELRRGITQ